jgi:uncharacterized protein (TIGR02996 family)
MTTLDALLHAIVADPQNEDRWLVLADWLEEHDDVRRAELLRLHHKLLATCCEPERYPERAAWHAQVVELIAQGVRPCLPSRSVVLAKGVEMRFSFIPPGSFLMGSPEDEQDRDWDEDQHRVTLTKAFWLGTCPVTQMQWREVMGTNPSFFPGDNRPVDTVSWDDCESFCLSLAKKTGLQFALPTEAQWEYACRAGTTTAYYTGNGLQALKRAGWCSYDSVLGSAKETRPVCQLEPNAWGLFDTHGNVAEWCADYRGEYPQGDVQDPFNGNESSFRTLRGGWWYGYPSHCRSAYRLFFQPDIPDDVYGFRAVLKPND